MEIQGRECLEAEGGGGREGRKGTVSGKDGQVRESSTRMHQHFASNLVPTESSSPDGALAGWGSRMRFQLLAADVPLALAGVPEYLIQGGAVVFRWINCCQLLGGWSKKEGDWIYGRLFMFARGV